MELERCACDDTMDERSCFRNRRDLSRHLLSNAVSFSSISKERKNNTSRKRFENTHVANVQVHVPFSFSDSCTHVRRICTIRERMKEHRSISRARRRRRHDAIRIPSWIDPMRFFRTNKFRSRRKNEDENRSKDARPSLLLLFRVLLSETHERQKSRTTRDDFRWKMIMRTFRSLMSFFHPCTRGKRTVQFSTVPSIRIPSDLECRTSVRRTAYLTKQRGYIDGKRRGSTLEKEEKAMRQSIESYCEWIESF